jgi:hypothetical protein
MGLQYSITFSFRLLWLYLVRARDRAPQYRVCLSFNSTLVSPAGHQHGRLNLTRLRAAR